MGRKHIDVEKATMKSALIILLSYFLLFADLLSQPVKHIFTIKHHLVRRVTKQLEKSFATLRSTQPLLRFLRVPADYYGNTLQEILHELLYQTPFEAVLQR